VGTHADLFVLTTLDLTGAPAGFSSRVSCQFDVGDTEQSFALVETAERTDEGWEFDSTDGPAGHLHISSDGPALEAAVRVGEAYAHPDSPVVDPTWRGTDIVSIEFNANIVREASVAFAVWHGVRPSCTSTVAGVAQPIEVLDGSRARIYVPGDFDGIAAASVKSVAAATVKGTHRHEVDGVLGGVFFRPFVGTATMTTTRPDGTTATGEQRIYEGAPGSWQFDFDSVSAAEQYPVLALMDLPADWHGPASP
jgi:hypothetical protein